MQLTLRLLALLLLTVVTAVGCTSQAEPAATNYDTVSLTIEGMSCAEGCAPQVVSTLSELGSVKECKVDFEKKTATVKVVKGTDPSTLIHALDGTKFSGTLQ